MQVYSVMFENASPQEVCYFQQEDHWELWMQHSSPLIWLSGYRETVCRAYMGTHVTKLSKDSCMIYIPASSKRLAGVWSVLGVPTQSCTISVPQLGPKSTKFIK